MKTAWVMGATGFWGRNVTLSLLRSNWRVVALARSQPEDLSVWARSRGQELVWLPFDLQNPDWQISELANPPQALFHCAAVFTDDLEMMLQVNLVQPVCLIEKVLYQMQTAGAGRVGVFLGHNGRLGLPGLGNFSATQGALWTWAEARSRSLSSTVSLSLVFPPRAPSQLQGQLARQLTKKPRLARRPTAEPLVKGVLLGRRRVGRWPWPAALSTLQW